MTLCRFHPLAFAMLALASLGAAAERGPAVDHSHTT